MLVIFSSKASADITMFGDIAVRLIKLMGHSGTVPSAINADDVPAALALLKAAIEDVEKLPETKVSEEDEDEEDSLVTLPHRALPLIKLLQAAAHENSYIMWDYASNAEGQHG